VASVVARPAYQSGYNGGYGGGYGMVVPSPAPQPVVVFGGPGAMVSPTTLPKLDIASLRMPPESIVRDNGVVMFSVDLRLGDGRQWRVLRRYNHFSDLADRLGPQARSLMCAPFPRKHLTGCEGSKLEQRRAALELWISQVLAYSDSYDYASWRAAISAFLEVPTAAAAASAMPVAMASPVASALPVGLPNVAVATPVSGGLQNLAGAVRVSTPLARGSPTASTGAAAFPPLPPPSEAPPMASSGPGAPPLPPPSNGPPAASSSPEAIGGYAMEIEVPPGVAPGQHLGVTVPSGEQLLLKVPEGAVAGQTLNVWYEGGVLQAMM